MTDKDFLSAYNEGVEDGKLLGRREVLAEIIEEFEKLDKERKEKEEAGQ